MRLILFLLACSIFLKASSVNLDEILKKLEYEHPTAKSIKAYEAAYNSDNKVKLLRESVQLTMDGSYAKADLDRSKYEYSIGVEQKFMNPSVEDSISRSARYQSDAEILNLKHDFLLLENDVRFLYHINCLDKQAIEEYKASYLSFKTLYMKKEKAYKYGEISKKELLQLQIELSRLKSEYKHIENEEKTSRNNFQSKILLPIFEESILSCKDTYSVIDKLLINNNEASLQVESLNKKIKSTESDFNQYSSMFDSYTLSAAYQDEIDTKRFVVGLSIPLNFTSSINEERQSAALHKKNALEYEKYGLKLEREFKVKLLEKRLLESFHDIGLVTSMLKKYEDELMPLIERGYRLGEDSAIEYLLSQREMWMYKKDLIQQHKNYYEVLFKLYSVLEIKD